jgi:hypothetical protein
MSDTLETDLDTEAPPLSVADQFPMPPGAMRLPSGGWAQLRPFDDLTGRDIRVIRRALNAEGTGDILGGALAAGIGAVVCDWQIPNRPQLELPTREPSKVLDRLPARDLLALEAHVRPFVEQILGKEDKGKADEPDPS